MSSNKVLVVVDIQKEYVTEGRPFQIKSIAPSLRNAEQVLKFAREQNWPIYHIRHLQDGSIFNPLSELSGFVEGFEPMPGEAEIHKGNFSCYSAPEFADAMRRHGAAGQEIIVIGYGATMCCISTIIDGYHRGQKFVYVSDASNAKATGTHSEESLHSHATDIISTFATVTSTSQLLES